MARNKVELYLIRHGTVSHAKSIDGEDLTFRSDIPPNEKGTVEMFGIAEYLLNKGVKTVDVIFSSPRPRSTLSAIAFSYMIPSDFHGNEMNIEEFCERRYFQILRRENIDIRNCTLPLTLELQKKLTVQTWEEIEMDLVLRRMGIVSKDELDDFMAPPDKYDGVPKSVWKENYRNRKPILQSVSGIQKVLQNIVREYQNKKVIIITHENVILTMMHLLSQGLTFKELSDSYIEPAKNLQQYALDRGCCWSVEVGDAGQVVNKECVLKKKHFLIHFMQEKV